MIISVNWLKQFTQINASLDELTEVIGARLVEIEGVTSIGAKYDGVVIARIVECAPVEDSDHLNLTKIDDGGIVTDVERDEAGLVQVVCGAPNVRAGMLVAWLPPGSTVPETAGDDEPFVLGARKLRGHMSNGMLASARELDLFDSHEGIVEIDKDVAPGTLFVNAYALDDHLLDIENKSLTHRPDAFGVIGFAREVAAIAGSGFTTPAWYEDVAPTFADVNDTVALSATIDNDELSRRYQALALSVTTVGTQTPLEIQTYLARSGVRPISPIVDVTNYVMLLTGQPLHAFDYDKIVAVAGDASLRVRAARNGETLALLDGRTVALVPDDIVIAAGNADRAVALAGAMGGAETEIDDSTTRIIIEGATFNLYNLRRTQMRHGVFSEALTRFTKGQPAALTAPVLAYAASLLTGLVGAVPITDVCDEYPKPDEVPMITVSVDTINGLLGTQFSADDVVETLGNVGFDVTLSDAVLRVTPPFWRTDIEIMQDVIEEVGRLNGFDLISPHLPLREINAVSPDAGQVLRRTVATILSSYGANEVLTYGFVHGDMLARAGQSADSAIALKNAISPDLQYYRLSLTPSLLDKVSANLRQKFDEFTLFEIGKTHVADVPDPDEPALPAEFSRVALTYAATPKQSAGRGAAYYTVRRYLDGLLARLNIAPATYVPLADNDSIDIASAPFEPLRSAAVFIGETYIGIVGEYKPGVARAFKLPAFSAGFELLLEPLANETHTTGSYAPLSRYPASDSDITFIIQNTQLFNELENAVAGAAQSNDGSLRVTYAVHDIYKAEETVNVTFRFTVTSLDKTLTRADVNNVMSAIIARVESATAARTV